MRSKRRAVAAFTLLEVLLVLVILVVLGSMATLAVTGQQDKALRNSARAQVQLFSRTIEQYRFDMKKMPESLDELVEKPSDSKLADRWAGPYLNKKTIPLDPWDNDYRYESKDNDFKVWSVGPDGSDGTDDDVSSDDEGT
ncbi:type II secretion system major pseudopilin GspG [Botrimarina colliarenosi]|uniref:type II secretion system major pseudopilin GspG n=1 Tax=Botrimarina colliarenosi TaxID=2528001 RepID=UPI0018D2F4CA|nr:type II secretion system major pseudopilin GspG [Botrimarina colliarenosi]